MSVCVYTKGYSSPRSSKGHATLIKTGSLLPALSETSWSLGTVIQQGASTPPNPHTSRNCKTMEGTES